MSLANIFLMQVNAAATRNSYFVWFTELHAVMGYSYMDMMGHVAMMMTCTMKSTSVLGSKLPEPARVDRPGPHEQTCPFF